MPTYVYKCAPNEHVFEMKQKFSDDPLTECVVCGGEVRKVIRNVGIVFKGSGFYVTDTRSKNSAAPKTNGNENDKAKESGDSGSSDGVSSEKSGASKSENKAEPAKSTSAET